MPNPIKYNTGIESLALEKGNFWVGTNDVSKGPTSSTGYYAGISPASGGYVVYINKASNGPAIYAPANDAGLIALTNTITGAGYTTVDQCLQYFATQNDMMVVNRDYEPIITNGLILHLDGGYLPSFPRSGSTWYDLSGNGKNASLLNGPTYTSANGGGVRGDGSDDAINISGIQSIQPTDRFSLFATFSVSGVAGTAVVDNNSVVFGRGEPLNVLGNFGIGVTYNQPAGTYTIDMGMRTFSNQFLNTSISYTLGSVVSVGFTYTPGQIRFFLNGSLYEAKTNNNVTSSTLTTSLFRSWTSNVVVSGNSRRSGGTIYVASIYNRALSDDEVLQNFTALNGRFGLG